MALNGDSSGWSDGSNISSSNGCGNCDGEGSLGSEASQMFQAVPVDRLARVVTVIPWFRIAGGLILPIVMSIFQNSTGAN